MFIFVLSLSLARAMGLEGDKHSAFTLAKLFGVTASSGAGLLPAPEPQSLPFREISEVPRFASGSWNFYVLCL